MFRTVRELVPRTPYRVGLLALALRHNPSGGPVLDNPRGQRLAMSGDDPRWRGLFGAAFLVGYAAEAAAAGLDAVTFGAVAGPSSFVAAGQYAGSSEGDTFPSFPMLAKLAAGSRRPRLDVRSSEPGRIRAISWMPRDGEIAMLVANCSDETIELAPPFGGQGRLRGSVFDASWARTAHADQRESFPVPRDRSGPVALDPYAVAFFSG